MNAWHFTYEGFRPAQEGLREALCTLGNGYFAVRGAAPEAEADDVHYPGTYLASGYDRVQSDIAGHVVENEDLVNFPNWLVFTFRKDEEDVWFNLRGVEILDYTQTLDLANGLLLRDTRFRDRYGRVTRLEQRRLVHIRLPHLAGLESRVTAENWSGPIEVVSAIDGGVINAGVQRYRPLNGKHLETRELAEAADDVLFLKTQTRQSQVVMAQAVRTRAYRNGKPIPQAPSLLQSEDYVAHHFDVALREGETVSFEKIVGLHTSRDRAISEAGLEARKTALRAPRFQALHETHSETWQQLWRRFDIDLGFADPGEELHVEQVLRLHVFHLLQTLSPVTMELDTGVPARGLHGEAYRGHVLWDELFVFPLFNLRIPEITRALLLYRYRRLDEARAAAQAAGYTGAMFPWQSASDGREETQHLHLNPRSGRWVPDNTHLQRHINAAIVYNVWQYFQVTRDLEFLAFYGAEVVLEIARFWSSIASYNAALDRYEILGVVGPDEYHDTYPGADTPGLNNNAYTNVMAAWSMCRALDVLQILPEDRQRELTEKLDLRDDELARWQNISCKMRVVFHDELIISQFEGYEDLAELDWEAYRSKYENVQRLDRILEAEGDTTNRYKVSKQADVLMLFYLFSADELYELFERLGCPLRYESIPANIDYYARRTSNGSTLSNVVHSWVLARVDRPRSWAIFKQALESDVADIQGGTTAEGIHIGAMAGSVDLIQRCYTGIETRGDVLRFNPALPNSLGRLQLHLRYRAQSLDVEMTRERLIVRTLRSRAAPIRIEFKGEVHTLAGEERREFHL